MWGYDTPHSEVAAQVRDVQHAFPLSWPYRTHPYPSYWGEINAHANFCEEDHIITTYIAEFVNTLTNVSYLLYAYHGIKNNASRKDAILRNLPYLGLAGVGIGSALFHATLKNHTQWCDDLSMLIATATVFHRIFTFNKSLRYTIISGLLISTIMISFMIWHCYTDELIMHSILFGIMVVIIGERTRSLTKTRISSPSLRKEVRKLAYWGSLFFVGGFALWNLDHAYCGALTAAKRRIGMPWGFFLEMHGWWHVLTAVGVYIFIALVEFLTSDEGAEGKLDGRWAWPVGWIVDERVGQQEKGEGRTTNGSVGKGKKDL